MPRNPHFHASANRPRVYQAEYPKCAVSRKTPSFQPRMPTTRPQHPLLYEYFLTFRRFSVTLVAVETLGA